MTLQTPDMTSHAGRRTAPRAVLYMVASMLFFSIMIGAIRHVSEGMNSLEVVFFRNLFGILIVAPLIVRGGGLDFLRTTKWKLYGLRGLFGLASMFLWFYAVANTPLAEAVVLTFTIPLFTTVAAIFLLGEVVGLRRWTAMVIGFGGALLILRPGFGEIALTHIMLLVSSALVAISIVLIKMLSRTEPAERIVAYMIILMTPASLIPALMVWQWPTLDQLFWLAVIGGGGTIAHLFMTRALSMADTSALMPYDFLRLPFVAAIAFVAFAEVPDAWTWTGGGIIFASSIYMAHRETRVARRTRHGEEPVKAVSASIEARGEAVTPQS